MVKITIKHAFQDSSEDEDIDEDSIDVATFTKTSRGSKILKLNGYRYRKSYKTKNGVRWVCSVNKNCNAHLVLSENDEIVAGQEEHDHSRGKSQKNRPTFLTEKEKAEPVVSRIGNVNLIHRKFAFRKKYTGVDKSRWVCATDKSCRGCIFVDKDYYVISALMEHCHPPPRIYKNMVDFTLDIEQTKINDLKKEECEERVRNKSVSDSD